MEKKFTDKKLIKSRRRVQNHGEVFTPNWLVNEMLNVEGVKEACETLEKTFLEPSAGEGVFLVEILNRKLNMVRNNYCENIRQYETFSLYALSKIYGVELLEDNAQMCVMNMLQTYYDHYKEVLLFFGKKANDKVIKSAKTIIKSNIAQGDFLTMKTSNDKPIIFSEWRLLNNDRINSNKNIRVIRTEHTLENIINDIQNENGYYYQGEETTIKEIQLDIFSENLNIEDNNDDNDYINRKYVATNITRVYEEEIIEF